MPGYEYHVFISYRRLNGWEGWVRDLFAPLLKEQLDALLPEPSKVYVDQQLPPGTEWDLSLCQTINLSRLMVPIFISNYFSSPNCRKELALMMHREEICGFRTKNKPDGLVLPITLVAPKFYPDRTHGFNLVDFQKFRYTSIQRDVPLYQHLQTAVNDFADKVATALDRVPPHDPAWDQLDGTHFLSQLISKPLDQALPPRIDTQQSACAA